MISDGKFKDIKYKSKVVEDLLIDAEKFGWDPKKNAVDDPTEPTKLVIPSTSEDGHDPLIDLIDAIQERTAPVEVRAV